MTLPIGEAAGEQALDQPSRAEEFSPFRIVGISTIAIGLMMLAISPWAGGGLALSDSRWLHGPGHQHVALAGLP